MTVSPAIIIAILAVTTLTGGALVAAGLVPAQRARHPRLAAVLLAAGAVLFMSGYVTIFLMIFLN